MKLYKQSIWISALICAIALIIAWLIRANSTPLQAWMNNVFVGLFASSLLLMVSSILGYLHDEKRDFQEYYWKLEQLKAKALALSTLPAGSEWKEYLSVITEINTLISGYFAICDQDYLFPKRQKIQKFLEVQNAICDYKNLSLNAEIFIRKYLCEKINERGEREYDDSRFRSDITPFLHATDKFWNTEEPFACFLDNKCREVAKYL